MGIGIQLSERAKAEARRFFEEHPVFEMRQLREISLEGPGGHIVELVEGRCSECGFVLRPAGNPMFEGDKRFWPADALEAVELRHAWDMQSRSHYCGGRIEFETAPVSGLVEA